MSSPLCLPVEEQQNGERIDKFLQESIPGMSRSQAQKWIAQGFVKIGEEQAGKNDKLKSRNERFVILPESAEDADGEIDWEAVLHPVCEPKPSNIPLDIVYEDEHLLVVNKPKDMVVHPGGRETKRGYIVNALLYHCDGKLATCNGIERQQYSTGCASYR